MAEVTIKGKQLRAYLKELGEQAVTKRIFKALKRATRRAQLLLQKESPVGVTGNYRAAWGDPPVETPDGFQIENKAPHAPIVEYGSRPHMPPVEPLILWCRRKLGLSEKEAKRAGWAIAMHIREHGTKGQHVAYRVGKQIPSIVLEELEREFAD